MSVWIESLYLCIILIVIVCIQYYYHNFLNSNTVEYFYYQTPLTQELPRVYSADAIQNYLVEMLFVIINICKKHKLTYWLDGAQLESAILRKDISFFQQHAVLSMTQESQTILESARKEITKELNEFTLDIATTEYGYRITHQSVSTKEFPLLYIDIVVREQKDKKHVVPQSYKSLELGDVICDVPDDEISLQPVPMGPLSINTLLQTEQYLQQCRSSWSEIYQNRYKNIYEADHTRPVISKPYEETTPVFRRLPPLRKKVNSDMIPQENPEK